VFDATTDAAALSPAARCLATKRAAEAALADQPIGSMICVPVSDGPAFYWRKAPRFMVRISLAEFSATEGR
jgi:hypothetical protein